MQLYLPGTKPLFWQQITAQPDSIYNQENNQTSSASIKQLLVSFVDKPINTNVSILINGAFTASAVVVDNAGTIYTRVSLPYTKNQDSINIEIKETSTGLILESAVFSTSHIAFTYEVQAQAADNTLIEAKQVEEDATIEGVSNDLLEDKYGVFTGVARRTDQTSNDYRAQTACLWQAYQYASTEKGFIDALRCILRVDVNLVITPTKQALSNTVYDNPQFNDVNNNIYDGIRLARSPYGDPDTPHYYLADKPADYRLDYTPITDDRPIDVIDPYPAGTLTTDPPFNVAGSTDNFSDDVVKSFTILTIQAIGSEVVVEMTPTLDVAVTEEAATSAVVGETMHRPDSVTSPFISTETLSNTHTFDLKVMKAIIGGIEITNPLNLPSEPAGDFTLDRLTGQITWGLTSVQPDPNTEYVVDYSFRLDDSLKAVIQRIKPAHKKVVIQFSAVASGLPVALIA